MISYSVKEEGKELHNDWLCLARKQNTCVYRHHCLLKLSFWNLGLQVNLEYLGRVVFNTNGMLYPDSVVGTDSHTTMIDGLGVAGWGVGGIEAEAAMLGQVNYLLTIRFLCCKKRRKDRKEEKYKIYGAICVAKRPIGINASLS